MIYPEGGGLEFCWRLRLALAAEGVELLDRIFVTGLLRDDDGRIVGAAGIHSRTGIFHVVKARATIVCTNAITFRSGFVRDITGTGTLLAYRAGAALRNAEFSYVRPGTPKFYFEGITFAIQEGAHFVNANGEPSCANTSRIGRDEADVPRIARAMALEKDKGNDPLYLDMSPIPEGMREYFIQSKVKWMDYFFRKLGSGSAHRHVRQDAVLRAQPDDQDGHPHRPRLPLGRCRACSRRAWRRRAAPTISPASISDCASATAGPPAAARSRISTGCRRRGSTPGRIELLHDETMQPLKAAAAAESDRILRDLQAVMFAYDVGILKSADRLRRALQKLLTLDHELRELAAPHTHELVRLKETEAMLLAARFMLEASLACTESRLSHFREDHPHRDDESWLVWIDLLPDAEQPELAKTPVPTPLCPVLTRPVRPTRLDQRRAVAGS